VGDALEVVAQAMGEVVHRVNAPDVPGVVVLGVPDAVEHRVAQPDVGRGHVDLRAERARAVGEHAHLHTMEQIEIFRDRAEAVGALLAGPVGRAPEAFDLLGLEVADVGLALPDECDGVHVKLVEVVAGEKGLQRAFGFRIADIGKSGPAYHGGEIKVRFAVHRLRLRRHAFRLEAEAVVRPAADQPPHVRDDGLDVLNVLLDRVGVVEPQVALAAVFAGDPEVEADRFGVADVQIAVGLRRKARDDPRIAFFRDVLRDDVADEIAGLGRAGVLILNDHK